MWFFCFVAVSSKFSTFQKFLLHNIPIFSFFFHVCSVPDTFLRIASLFLIHFWAIILRCWKRSFNLNRSCDQHPLTLKHHFLQPWSAHRGFLKFWLSKTIVHCRWNFSPRLSMNFGLSLNFGVGSSSVFRIYFKCSLE